MRFFYNTEPAETVAYLREAAISAKQPPQVIDALDAIADILELELPAEIEKLETQVNELENDKDDLRGELYDLLHALGEVEPNQVVVEIAGKTLLRAAKIALAALERHGLGSGDLRNLREQFYIND